MNRPTTDLDMRQALTEALIDFERIGRRVARPPPDSLHH